MQYNVNIRLQFYLLIVRILVWGELWSNFHILYLYMMLVYQGTADSKVHMSGSSSGHGLQVSTDTLSVSPAYKPVASTTRTSPRPQPTFSLYQWTGKNIGEFHSTMKTPRRTRVNGTGEMPNDIKSTLSHSTNHLCTTRSPQNQHRPSSHSVCAYCSRF
jgi:hypothetical protein